MEYLHTLQKLFAGKKFVQYIAAERLAYISGEASELLDVISNGRFGLETDEAGNFIIRDYVNGGAVRSVFSLSGGETFLVSLALALALSTQIQMKNEAVLDFFFLDEGFGTLDEDLLNEVMETLERLQNRDRVIGLISHVSELKERVPVKLFVSPPEMGGSGSHVRLEIS
jgi:exonuclease SbcC